MRIRGERRAGPGVKRIAALLAGAAGLLLLPIADAMAADDAQQTLNDYPTAARAEYVFACMATNGQSSDILRKCSCSIDIIASILPYKKYVEAETVLSMQLVGGERMSVFRTAASANHMVADLRRAQAEADIRCF
jgi:lysyl-tRNA synthetase class II